MPILAIFGKRRGKNSRTKVETLLFFNPYVEQVHEAEIGLQPNVGNDSQLLGRHFCLDLEEDKISVFQKNHAVVACTLDKNCVKRTHVENVYFLSKIHTKLESRLGINWLLTPFADVVLSFFT